MHARTISFIIILFGFNSAMGQKLTPADSIGAIKVTTEFFNWYLASMNAHSKTDYQPTFIEGKNGMTTLNFKLYFDNLREYHFTDKLISIEKKSYDECLKNLAGIKFTDFKTTFDDLDDFEKIHCDFENYYRWTGGQEPIDGIAIEKVEQINAGSILITLKYYDTGNNKDKTYWGKNRILLVKRKGSWWIDKVNWSN